MRHSLGLIALCLLTVSWTAMAGTDGKCRVVVFEGAGDIASYEAGAFQGLVKNLAAQDVAYDVVGGTGFGTINLAILASHAIGNETGAATAMADFWNTAKASDFYADWPLSIVQAIFAEYGLYNTAAYMQTMTKLLQSNKAQRKINLVAADANSGRLIRFDESTFKTSQVGLYVGASSFPGVFPHVPYNGMTLVDASVMNSLDLGGAITRCRNAGYADPNIIVDLIMTSSASTSIVNCSDYNAFSMIGRLITVYAYSFVTTDLYHSLANYKDVNFRYMVKPSASPYYNINPYTFNTQDMQKAMTQGYNDAVKAIKGGKQSRVETFEEMGLMMDKIRPGRAQKDVSHVYRDYPEPQYTL
jgi:predicted acylesterase/phospholipase RssA